jgi:predicted CoA-substrate-specific enzyme activase
MTKSSPIYQPSPDPRDERAPKRPAQTHGRNEQESRRPAPAADGPVQSQAGQASERRLRAGLDFGSTTVKIAVVDADTHELLFSRYRRHHAELAKTAIELLHEAEQTFGGVTVRLAVCGSGGKPIAEALGVPYVQEVVANTVAVRMLYPRARTAIELGGQDAKVVFFAPDPKSGRLVASDMRMNGSCAGGTGAFIDEVATLLDAEQEGLEDLASRGSRVYQISGRCGVFAKTDIQPLLIQGIPREDLALSAFHAIAKQTIGGLSQGLELTAPIIFEGGPLTYNPTLVRVFAERLQLEADDIIIPKHPETIVAAGCALAIDELFGSGQADDGRADASGAPAATTTFDAAAALLGSYAATHLTSTGVRERAPLFASDAERMAFNARHDAELGTLQTPSGKRVPVYLGVDSGSTTSKGALVAPDGAVVDTFYAHNDGDPVGAVRHGLLEMQQRFTDRGQELEILGCATTGYGEKMLARALGADCSTVETVAHATGCMAFVPDATFILDIGGQDMKAIWLDHGVVTNIMLNEACSSGCGSFLENFAGTLEIPVEQIADAAFSSKHPADLGSRCTVFMNSSIITEQRNGKQSNDIMAGLCRSIIENVFTKVVRIADVSELGDRIVVQGGTFRNRAVLRALEEYVGRDVTLSPFPGEMGAIGAALYAMEYQQRTATDQAWRPVSTFIGFDALRDLTFTQEAGVRCTRCANACSRTITRFSTGAYFVSGNRCDRSAVVEDIEEHTATDADAQAKAASVPEEDRPAAAAAKADGTAAAKSAATTSKSANRRTEQRPVAKVAGSKTEQRPAANLFDLRQKLLFAKPDATPVREAQDEVIGLPRVLEFWDSMPFWTTFLTALGYTVKTSHPSSHKLFEKGLRYVASDTICLPAKLVHGHVLDLCEQGVDRILLPYVMHMPPEGTDKMSPYMCAILMGYPMVVRNFQDPAAHFDVTFDTPVFHWFSEKNRHDQICEWARKSLNATEEQVEAAYEQGAHAILNFRTALRDEAQKVLDDVHAHDGVAVVLAGRPYHTDPFVNHGIAKQFVAHGIPVLTSDCLPGQHDVPLDNLLPEVTNDFHTRMLESALIAANDPSLEYVQIVSFGCGHDAILSDEICRIVTEVGGKHPLILKMDESDATGSLGIRIQSFVETVQARRRRDAGQTPLTTGAVPVQNAAASDGATNPASAGEPGASSPAAAASDGTTTSDAAAASDGTTVSDNTTTTDSTEPQGTAATIALPPNPYRIAYRKEDKTRRTVLVPNISGEISLFLQSVMLAQGFQAVTIPVGGPEQIRIGKRYTHNDICFPCQMVIGEVIDALDHGNWSQDEVAVGMVKFKCDCRMSHYAALLRRALDKAGYTEVPILTTDPVDTKGMHDGVHMLGITATVKAIWAAMMLDILQDLKRKTKPYELNPGQTEEVFQSCVHDIANGIVDGVRPALAAYRRSIDAMAQIPYDRSHLKPRVFVTGELLVTYHAGSNFHIEDYLVDNGMEAIFPRMTDQLRKDFIAAMSEIKDFDADMTKESFLITKLFNTAQSTMERIARKHPLYQHAMPPAEAYEGVSDIIPKTLSCGEGWLMAAEIAEYAREGVRSFIILQPFGCLPNHICGRGVTKRLKDEFPGIQILPLDLDPDTSFANVENRLQMLIMNDKAAGNAAAASGEGAKDPTSSSDDGTSQHGDGTPKRPTSQTEGDRGDAGHTRRKRNAPAAAAASNAVRHKRSSSIA